MNCKSISVKDIEKQLVLPGLISEKIEYKYSSKIISKKSFKILSIKIDNIDTAYGNFKIIQLPNGTLKKTTEILQPGEYYIELHVANNDIKKSSIDVLTIEILVGNKRLEIKGETLLMNDLLKR